VPWFTTAPLEVVAAGLAVAHVHLSPAMATSEQAREYKLAPPCRAARHGTAFFGRVVCNHTLVPLELRPRDVAFVLIFRQYIPIRPSTPKSTSHAFSPVLDDGLACRASERIGARAMSLIAAKIMEGAA